MAGPVRSASPSRVRVASAVPIADVVRYAAAGDVGIIPFLNTSLNNFHGLPNKIFEYIAAGIPVVASDFPQLRAVIDRYDVGITFDPDRPGALAGRHPRGARRPGAPGDAACER